MQISKLLGILSLCLLVISVFQISQAAEMIWGEGVGLISATVSASGDSRGAPIRSGPSQESEIVTYLQTGTRIQGENEFSKGWVKLKAPAQGGWIRLSALKPHPLEGIVTKVSQTEFCLPLKKGPGEAFENADCAQIGEVLKFSGVGTRDGWLQLAARNGWVTAASVDLAALAAAEAKPQETKPSAKWEEPAAAGPLAKAAPQEQPRVTSSKGPTKEEAEEEGDAKVCIGDWCVDFSDDTITRAGKAQSFVDCARDMTCARILAETWVAALEDQDHVEIPISDTMVLRLERDGRITSASSGNVFVNCSGDSGPVPACVVAFLLELSRPISDELRRESAAPTPSGKAPGAPTSMQREQTAPKADKSRQGHYEVQKMTKSPYPKAAAKSGPAPRSRPTGESDTGSFSPPASFRGEFFNQGQMQKDLIEERWEDAQRLGL